MTLANRIAKPRLLLYIISAAFFWNPVLGQQWTSGSGGAIYYNGGNVGIGTMSPAAALVVNTALTMGADAFFGNSIVNGRGHLRLYAGGPGAGIIGNQYFDGTSLRRVQAGGGGWAFFDTTNSTTAGDITFATWANGTADSVITPSTVMTIKQNGNVGIGTTNPQYKLAVNGNIGAQDIIVTNTGWPDYVFRPDYRLRPLSEVSAFIQKHHHLPDIPTETEVKEKGVGLGDMQAKLLAKVEELTLHLIQQEKQNKELRERLAQLENRVSADTGVASGR